MSAKDALYKFYHRQQREIEREQRPRARNQKPERELVQKPCMKWFKENGWSMNVVEAKATYNLSAGRYDRGQTDPGVADAFGCTPDGAGAFVEFKAPGRRSSLKGHQYDFLKEKIMKGCFAVCVDSVECLAKVWTEFQEKRKVEPMLGRNVLLKHLPKKEENARLSWRIFE